MQIIKLENSVLGQYRGYRDEYRVAPIHAPQLTPPCAFLSITGAGRESLFTCGPENIFRINLQRFSSSSNNHRWRCSLSPSGTRWFRTSCALHPPNKVFTCVLKPRSGHSLQYPVGQTWSSLPDSWPGFTPESMNVCCWIPSTGTFPVYPWRPDRGFLGYHHPFITAWELFRCTPCSIRTWKYGPIEADVYRT